MGSPGRPRRPAPADPDRVDVSDPPETSVANEDDDVYESFPGLNPVRW
jgi:hypothetical protein